jgi:hypothetical protein
MIGIHPLFGFVTLVPIVVVGLVVWAVAKPRPQAPPPPPQLSPDGKWWWDGQKWIDASERR